MANQPAKAATVTRLETSESTVDKSSEVERLRAENERLRKELADAREKADDKEASRKPHVPDFMPEGTRQELEERGEAVNPFNGERVTKDDLSQDVDRPVTYGRKK